MTACETNLLELIDNREKVWRHMRKNAHKYLAFASVNFLKRLYSSGEKLYLSNSIIFFKFL